MKNVFVQHAAAVAGSSEISKETGFASPEVRDSFRKTARTMLINYPIEAMSSIVARVSKQNHIKAKEQL